MQWKNAVISVVVCSVFSSTAFAQSSRPHAPADPSDAAPGILATGGPAPSTRFLAFASGTNEVSTTSTSWANVPDMEVAIDTVGSCISATFSAEVSTGSASTQETIGLKALLDGAVVEGLAGGNNNTHTVKSPYNYYELVSFTFWKCGVSRDSHILSIQWTSYAGNSIYVRGRTLIVQGR